MAPTSSTEHSKLSDAAAAADPRMARAAGPFTFALCFEGSLDPVSATNAATCRGGAEADEQRVSSDSAQAQPHHAAREQHGTMTAIF